MVDVTLRRSRSTMTTWSWSGSATAALCPWSSNVRVPPLMGGGGLSASTSGAVKRVSGGGGAGFGGTGRRPGVAERRIRRPAPCQHAQRDRARPRDQSHRVFSVGACAPRSASPAAGSLSNCDTQSEQWPKRPANQLTWPTLRMAQGDRIVVVHHNLAERDTPQKARHVALRGPARGSPATSVRPGWRTIASPIAHSVANGNSTPTCEPTAVTNVTEELTSASGTDSSQ